MDNRIEEKNRIKKLIEDNAEKHKNETEEWASDDIEIRTFSEIIKFSQLEDLEIDKTACSILLDNENYNEERLEEISMNEGMLSLMDELEEDKYKNSITLELYRIFNKQFFNLTE